MIDEAGLPWACGHPFGPGPPADLPPSHPEARAGLQGVLWGLNTPSCEKLGEAASGVPSAASLPAELMAWGQSTGTARAQPPWKVPWWLVAQTQLRVRVRSLFPPET